ncbi:UPF0220-domain-containing protein [Gloeopeniophorella convolvens]|nr:UPF0220-domain-containing protein [Gloeopeniophorella convolvens]
MSLPHSDYDPRRVCLNPFPFLDNITLGKHRRTAGVYLAGGLFSLGLWTFFDAAILSAYAHPPYGEPDYPVPVHVSFADWGPPLCALLGTFVTNLIDKDCVRGDAGFGDACAVSRTRLIFFVGFAFMAGSVQHYGYANAASDVSLVLSIAMIWVAQSGSGEYEYSLLN